MYVPITNILHIRFDDVQIVHYVHKSRHHTQKNESLSAYFCVFYVSFMAPLKIKFPDFRLSIHHIQHEMKSLCKLYYATWIKDNTRNAERH